MSCSNHFLILLSDGDDKDSPNNTLPPSDKPQYSEVDSGSESETGTQTPISCLPALLPLPHNTMATPESSPIAQHRIFRFQRSSSAPLLPSEMPSSNNTVMFTPHAEKRFITQCAQAKWQETLGKNKLDKEEATAAQKRSKEEEEERQQKEKRETFDGILDGLQNNNHTLTDFLEHIFNPDTKLAMDWCWQGFFFHCKIVEHVFGWWTTSRYNQMTCSFIHNWATMQVENTAYTEARSITQSGILCKSKKVIDEKFFLDFRPADVTSTICGMAPTTFHIFSAFLTTAWQEKEATPEFLEKKKLMQGAAALTRLHTASQQNNYLQAVTSLYLAATGAQCQHLSVLSLYEATIDYTSIITSRSKAGIETTTATAEVTDETVEDDLNTVNNLPEDNDDAQENGTCVTLIPLHNAKLKHLLTADLDRSILEAHALHINDILLSEEESAFFSKSMVHTILHIIINHAQTSLLYLLPTMEIDESSITGNVEVLEQINKTLGFDVNDPDFAKYVQVVASDQLTIACQCSILNVRLSHESSTHSWKHVVLMPGHFHAKIADCHGVLETHFGKVGAGTHSLQSLGFHNTVLDRLPITLTSLPLFCTCCDLIMVSL
ncbi:hypothetical protein C8J57DRAFT_1497679 [Mycena rebaudengoi]|nr:hypothetical protein C8J57DRAFT_1497679 [Mycena rebaudengoi]